MSIPVVILATLTVVVVGWAVIDIVVDRVAAADQRRRQARSQRLLDELKRHP